MGLSRLRNPLLPACGSCASFSEEWFIKSLPRLAHRVHPYPRGTTSLDKLCARGMERHIMTQKATDYCFCPLMGFGAKRSPYRLLRRSCSRYVLDTGLGAAHSLYRLPSLCRADAFSSSSKAPMHFLLLRKALQHRLGKALKHPIPEELGELRAGEGACPSNLVCADRCPIAGMG